MALAIIIFDTKVARKLRGNFPKREVSILHRQFSTDLYRPTLETLSRAILSGEDKQQPTNLVELVWKSASGNSLGGEIKLRQSGEKKRERERRYRETIPILRRMIYRHYSYAS